MIHSLFVLRAQGESVLFERIYDLNLKHENKARFVQDVVSLTKKDWNDGSSTLRVALVGLEKTVVFCQLNTLVFFICGTKEYDELILGEALQFILELVVNQCDKGVTEGEFLAQYDRIGLMVDHVIRHGQLQQTNKEVLSALINLAPEKVSASTLQKNQLEKVSVPSFSVPSLHASASPMTKKKSSNKNSKTVVTERPRVDSNIIVAKKK